MEKDLIKQKAIYILNELGSVVDSDYMYNYSGNYLIWCTYNIQGLTINSNELPYKEKSSDSKQYIKDVSIIFDDKFVFNSDTSYYEPGFWEELLQALYEKVPKIIANQEKQAELLRRGNEFFNKALKDINLDTKIGNDIEIKNEFKDAMDWLDRDTAKRSVYYKDELVLEAYGYGINAKEDLSVVQYVPGEWEEKVLEYSKDLEERRKESEKKYNEKRLLYIRNL